MACSISPLASTSADLQSIIPAPVFSRSSFTSFAVIAMFSKHSLHKNSPLYPHAFRCGAEGASLLELHDRRFVRRFDGFVGNCLGALCANSFAGGIEVRSVFVFAFFNLLRRVLTGHVLTFQNG